jgi:K+-sensing histidine kinase KdpD
VSNVLRPYEVGGTPSRYALAVAAVVGVTATLAPFPDRLSPTTVGFALLLAVLFVAAGGGMGPAVVASVLGMLSFNFFFLPPLHTLTVRDPENWVALAAFLVTAITAGQLSARAGRRAEEAETARGEVERLYTELREAFERASRAEALRQAERMRTALLDAVTHDLRTPLTSIKVSVSTLIDEAKTAADDEEGVVLEPEGRLEMLEVIDEETDRLDRFIGNLVELARIEAGQMQLRRAWTPADVVVSDALERAPERARTHRVEVDVVAEAPSMLADGRALSEALYTLVDNAAKYSPPGTRIRVVARSVESGSVLFAVEDEGPGIPEGLRERVFEKFFRVEEDPEVSSPPGTGMGLAIARGIVEAHGGTIRAGDAAGGRGARIEFTIPVGDEDDGRRRREPGE